MQQRRCNGFLAVLIEHGKILALVAQDGTPTYPDDATAMGQIQQWLSTGDGEVMNAATAPEPLCLAGWGAPQIDALVLGLPWSRIGEGGIITVV